MPTASAPLICPGHSRPVAALDFSELTDDGSFLISACHDKTAMLRSGETGDWIGTFEGHKGAVWGAALNHGATRAITCSADFSARIWDAITGDELQELKHKHIVRTASWSPSSSHVVTGGKEAKARLFDLSRPESEPMIFTGHTSMIKVVKYVSPQLVLSGGEDKTLCFWDTRTLAEANKLQFEGTVNSVDFSEDGGIFTVAAGNEVSFWETMSLQCIKRYTLGAIEGNGYGVNSATLHPNQKAFVAAGGNFWVYVHDFETGAELQCNKGHHGPVYAVRFAPGGRTYASGGDDGTIRIWSFSGDASQTEDAAATQ
mmetsp:Transcript_33821/g.74207  ORF Transcript_33821/g.74207 Transcript_33821/m.74207 type:complete len:315 (-) Transcript_33821:752-1696(-)